MKIVLASGSPRRRELLGDLGLRLEVRAPKIDETAHPGEKPRAYVLRVASEKHRAIASGRPKAVVIAADTIVVLEGKILGKPTSRLQAEQMLRRLSGQTHTVLTAVWVGTLETRLKRVVATRVRFRKLSRAQIVRYLRSGESMDKAGAYGAQGTGRVLIASIQGSYTNVIGLPMAETVDLLATLGVPC